MGRRKMETNLSLPSADGSTRPSSSEGAYLSTAARRRVCEKVKKKMTWKEEMARKEKGM